MRNMIIAAVATILFALFGFGDVAEAGQKCPAKMSRDACEVWLRQMSAPALKGPKAPSEPVRCVAVLSDQPSALVLRDGKGNRGPAIISWRLATLNWKQTRRGFETTVCFPKRLVGQHAAMTLCGAIGHSSWGSAEMAYLRQSNVGAHDPACTGGMAWCSKRGL